MHSGDSALDYLPLHWCKLPPEAAQAYHTKFIEKESEVVRRTVPCQLGVDYGYSDNEKIDIFGIDLPDDSPTVVYVHGGYWQKMSRSLSSYVAKALYKEGIRVMVVGYNLCPFVTMEEIVDEIKKAVQFCLTYAKKIGSRSVALGGHSAGAHLVASVFMDYFHQLPLEEQNLVKIVYLLSGVYDLVPIIESPFSDPLHINPPLATKLSPAFSAIRSKNKMIDFKLFVGMDESPAFQEQSRKYHEILGASGYNSQFIVLENMDHFNIVRNMTKSDYEVVKMLKALIKYK